MAKYYGMIGYGIAEETSPDVYEVQIHERPYYGDVIRNQRTWKAGEGLNDNLDISNEISIVADPFAYQHFHDIRYVTWMGAKWKVRTITVERPRLRLQIGGVYNEQTEGIEQNN